jgi:hypothetical protein
MADKAKYTSTPLNVPTELNQGYDSGISRDLDQKSGLDSARYEEPSAKRAELPGMDDFMRNLKARKAAREKADSSNRIIYKLILSK